VLVKPDGVRGARRRDNSMNAACVWRLRSSRVAALQSSIMPCTKVSCSMMALFQHFSAPVMAMVRGPTAVAVDKRWRYAPTGAAPGTVRHDWPGANSRTIDSEAAEGEVGSVFSMSWWSGSAQWIRGSSGFDPPLPSINAYFESKSRNPTA
jgi:hypothetical protein